MSFYCLFIYLHLSFLALAWTAVYRCSNNYTDHAGFIYSPSIPNKYEKDEYCVNIIQAPTGYRIHLKWETFKVAGYMPLCTKDYVRITRCTSPLIHLIRYCGTDFKPNDIYSYDNCIRVEFKLTQKGNDYGFTMSYNFFLASSSMTDRFSCSGKHKVDILPDNSGIIKSPNWPLTYSGLVAPGYGDYAACTWRVNIPSKRKIKILFMGIDLYKGDTNTNMGSCKENDALIVKGTFRKKKYIYTSKYVGTIDPFAVTYKDFKYIDFIIRTCRRIVHNHTGFVIGVVTYGTQDKTAKKFPYYGYFGFAVLAMFLFSYFKGWFRNDRCICGINCNPDICFPQNQYNYPSVREESNMYTSDIDENEYDSFPIHFLEPLSELPSADLPSADLSLFPDASSLSDSMVDRPSTFDVLIDPPPTYEDLSEIPDHPPPPYEFATNQVFEAPPVNMV